MAQRPSLESVVQALESQLDTIKYFYDRKAGEVVMIDEEFGEVSEDLEQQEDQFILIPSITSNERFQIMEDFVETLTDENLQEMLNRALIEKGAFQRFEEVLQRYPPRQEQWHRFRTAKVEARALEWFRNNGFQL
jgi:F0F1-type ATP synthase delta subunit